MATFTVNGTVYHVIENQKLLTFLRDELHLTSVKDGCSEGACGTCHVLIDGKAVKACVLQTDKLDGKTIITVEGLSDWEKRVYTFAFGEAGAVQCGFCIPGMVISAKALLDTNPNPTREEAAFAIRNNICRCTGYVKIIDGILLAAQVFRDGTLPDPTETSWQIGKRIARLDVQEKVQGYGQYPDDLYFDGMLYGGAVRSAYPRARVRKIDTAEAKKLPGVVCVMTNRDIPGEKLVGHIEKDQYTLVGEGEITHYLGDAIVLLAAVDRQTLAKAKSLVKIDYEVLPAVHNPKEASAPDAPCVFEGKADNLQAYRHIKRGDADAAIAGSRYVLRKHFSTPWTEHAFLEPECCVAVPIEDGVQLYTTDQSAHTTQHECSSVLGVDYDHCRVQNMLVGGGFGGKEDMSVQHHAALLCQKTKRPVKCKLSRAESLLVHPKRHPMEMDFTLGCDEFGKIQGVKVSVEADTGAFASLGGPVLERACTHAAGPYSYENFTVEGCSYYTNNPPAGAFRGFGVTQTCFAMESLLDEMADMVGISSLEIRYRNAIRPGGVLPNGQIVDDSTGLVETLDAVREEYERAVAAGDCVGLACAMKNAGVGVGLPDYGRCRLRVDSRGKVHIHAGASCIGQGLGTVLVQMVVTRTGLPREMVVYERSDTATAPDSGDTSGSRQTLVTGEATLRACDKLLSALEGRTTADLCGREFFGEYLAKTDPLGADVPNPISHVAYGYATQLCILDSESGRIKKIVAAHDVGTAINPLSLEGQIQGGVVMGMGFALTENYPIDENCRPTARYGTLGLFRAPNVPEITPIIVEKAGLHVANGAIGIGEITSIPTAPAIANAYFRYDGQRRYALPLSNTPYSKK